MLNSRGMTTSRPRVLVTELEYRKAEDTFAAEPDLECIAAPDGEADLALAIAKTQAAHVVVGARPYTNALYAALPAGGVIARFGVGHDGIDKAQATAAGLLCTNTPGVLNTSVAEHTMLLILAAARSVVAMAANMSRHEWRPAAGIELRGRSLAIVGCGGIGRDVARIASLGYGMRVVG